MPSYRMAAKAGKEPQEVRFIEVVEVATSELGTHDYSDFEALTRVYPPVRVKHFDLTQAPPAGMSWLREERGRAVLYRQS